MVVAAGVEDVAGADDVLEVEPEPNRLPATLAMEPTGCGRYEESMLVIALMLMAPQSAVYVPHVNN